MRRTPLKRKKRIRKKSERSKLVKVADDIVRAIVLIRDRECQRCASRQNLQRSHVCPKSIYPNLRFDLLNVKALCMRCHLYWWHKDPTDAAKWFADKFPAREKYLEEQKNRPCWRTSDLPEIIKTLEAKLTELENEQ